jgi:hypothetical protein
MQIYSAKLMALQELYYIESLYFVKSERIWKMFQAKVVDSNGIYI